MQTLKPAQPRLLTVVLHYGTAALTRQVVEALLPGSAPHRIMVLDNAAPEAFIWTGPNAGTDAVARADKVPKTAPEIVRLPRNIYWGGALDYALALARRENYSHLWFCNNDIRFTSPAPHIPRALARLHYAQKVLGRPVGIWAPAVHHNPYHAQMQHRDTAECSRVAYMDGIAPLLNIACVEAVGGLDAAENLRGYGLDIWLSLRAQAAGWPLIVDHSLTLKHDYHRSAKQLEGFLQQAAADEDKYLSSRLGQDWRALIRGKQEPLQIF